MDRLKLLNQRGGSSKYYFLFIFVPNIIIILGNIRLYDTYNSLNIFKINCKNLEYSKRCNIVVELVVMLVVLSVASVK